MVDAGHGWFEPLNRYLFHWLPEKAIWIGGHTLSWDARCAGIYIGFGAGVLCQLAAGRTRGRLPSVRVALLAALFMLPLFVDVLAIAAQFKAPSNDMRYATGLLWGAAFSIYLFPAFLILARPPGHAPAEVAPRKFIALLAAACASAWFLKGWDHLVAYGILETLAIFGCLGLAGILVIGLFHAARHAVLPRAVTTIVPLAAACFLLSACAAPPPTLRSGACSDADFVPSPYACLACKQEMCIGGKIVTVEDLTPAAPVDDWAEERFCLLHPIDCYRAYTLKQKIERWQKELVGTYWADDGLHNGLGDAARHVYLMCELTERFGAAFARALGTAHEEDSEYLIFVHKGVPSNPCCEKTTDLYNNEIGIALADRPGTCEEKTLHSLHRLQYSLCERRDRVMER
jgi:uncharacterized membrane protein